MGVDIKITDNSNKILSEFQAACNKALEECGLTAEGYAIKLCPVDTGALRNSITHQVVDNEKSVYIGSDMEYAPFVELGTGKYYDGGRKTPWVYQDSKTGEYHWTDGNPAQPFLKPAVAEHGDTYRSIIEKNLKGG